jgi:hypothetical protein
MRRRPPGWEVVRAAMSSGRPPISSFRRDRVESHVTTADQVVNPIEDL